MNYQDNAALMELKVLIFKKSELKDGHKHNILFFFKHRHQQEVLDQCR